MISIRHLGPVILSELDSTAILTICDDLKADTWILYTQLPSHVFSPLH
jgi:hypothetical protein